jgi:hypothetical protein
VVASVSIRNAEQRFRRPGRLASRFALLWKFSFSPCSALDHTTARAPLLPGTLPRDPDLERLGGEPGGIDRLLGADVSEGWPGALMSASLPMKPLTGPTQVGEDLVSDGVSLAG